MGLVTGGGAYEDEVETSIEATPNKGFVFVSWNDGNTDNPRSIIVSKDEEYTAFFEPEKTNNMFSISVKPNDDKMGEVFGGGEYAAGTEVEIGATPKDGFLFIRWNDDSDDNPYRIVVSKDAEYIAYFEAPSLKNEKCTITVSENDPAMGTASGGGVYDKGTEVTINAKANKGCIFDKWNDEDNANPRQVTVEKDALYIAIFKKEGPEPMDPKFIISVKPNDVSMGATSGGGEYAPETKIKISATANDGFVFEHWGDGNKDNPRVIAVKEAADYIAYFRKKQYKVTVVSDDNNMGSVTGGGSFDVGSKAEIKAIPKEGFCFVSWDDDNKDNPRTITVNSDVSFTAKFGKDVMFQYSEQERLDKESLIKRNRLNQVISSISTPIIESQVINPTIFHSITIPDEIDRIRMEGAALREKENHWLSDKLLWVSGVDRDLLRKSPGQHSWYIALSLVMIGVACVAALSLGYALSRLLQLDWYVILPVCIFWFGFILSIDRMFTTGTHGKNTIQRLFVNGGWLRLILSFVIGVVIATPMEMWIFEDDIQIRIDEKQGEKYLGNDQKIIKHFEAIYSRKIKADSTNYKNASDAYAIALNTESAAKKTAQNKADAKVIKPDENGNMVETVDWNSRNTSAKAAKEASEDVSEKKTKMDTAYSIYQNTLKDLETHTEDSIRNFHNSISNETSNQKNSFGRNLQILNEMKYGEKDRESAPIWIAILFIVIDMLPILFKCFMKNGPYENWKEIETELKKTHNSEEIKNLNNSLKDLEVNAYKDVYTSAINRWKNMVMDALGNPSD